LLDALRAESGKAPVLFTAGDDGISAFVAGKSRVLVAGKIGEAAMAPAHDLVFYVRAGKLEVLDLREPAPKPIVVVTKMPDEVPFQIQDVVDSGMNFSSTFLTIELGKKPKLVAEEGIYFVVDESSGRKQLKAIRKAKIAGKFLTTLAARTRRNVDKVAANAQKLPIAGVADRCEDEESCGQTFNFGNTGLLLLVAEHSCGDACHLGCVLYDPKKKTYAVPPEAKTWTAGLPPSGETASCGPYIFTAARDMFFSGSSVCKAGGPCSERPDRPLGWADPGPAVGFND